MGALLLFGGSCEVAAYGPTARSGPHGFVLNETSRAETFSVEVSAELPQLAQAVELDRVLTITADAERSTGTDGQLRLRLMEGSAVVDEDAQTLEVGTARTLTVDASHLLDACEPGASCSAAIDVELEMIGDGSYLGGVDVAAHLQSFSASAELLDGGSVDLVVTGGL